MRLHADLSFSLLLKFDCRIEAKRLTQNRAKPNHSCECPTVNICTHYILAIANYKLIKRKEHKIVRER